MLNPLLHTSSSAPTSPMLTRSIHVQPAHLQSSSKAVTVGANAIVAAVTVARRGPRQALMQRMSRDSSPVGPSSPVVTSEAALTSAASSSRRRLSRVVKCRTLDFTEFPEGMREYAFYAHATGNNNNSSGGGGGGGGGKMLVRESRSQPGSPVSIPKIQVQDFGNFAGSEVRKEIKDKRTEKERGGRNVFYAKSEKEKDDLRGCEAAHSTRGVLCWSLLVAFCI